MSKAVYGSLQSAIIVDRIYMIALNFCQITIIITSYTHRDYKRDIVVWIYIFVKSVNVGLIFTMNLTTMANEGLLWDLKSP